MRPELAPWAERRARIHAVLRALPDRPAAARLRRAIGALRQRPDAVLAVVLAAGVVAMILHWR